MKLENSQAFLTLVRLGINHELINDSKPTIYDAETINWTELKALAERQGLFAILMDGIEKLRTNDNHNENENLPKQMALLEWIGEVLHNYEHRYQAYQKAIRELAGFYNAHGLKMMVLKGYACNIDWPKPEHRPCGDIDIWLFGKQKEADASLEAEKGIKIDNSHHHHTVFYWGGFMVENHYDFINIHHHKSNVGIEKILKKLGEDDSHYIELNGEKVYSPSPNLHALFLLRHALNEFAAGSINIRQLLDWAFFLEKHGKEVDWDWLHSVLDEYHMRDFYNCINGICVDNLGFESTLFPLLQFNSCQKDRVLNEILDPEIPNNKPQYLIIRVFWKINRWKANEWKHKLCYKESMWSAFWSGVWSHLLKPASI